MKALFDTYFHLYRPVIFWLSPSIGHKKFFLLGDFIVVTIDDDIDIVAESAHDPIVRLKLLFYSVKLKIILHIVRQRPWRLQIPHNLQKSAILVFVKQVFYDSDKFNTYSKVVDALVFIKSNADLAFDIFSILNIRDKNK